jgi:hypothetical protein
MERNEQGVFTTALLKAARTTLPDLNRHVVSAARVFSEANEALWKDDEALPQSSGSLEDFPMALTDTVRPLGGAEFLQQPKRLVSQPGTPLSARFELAVRLMGRRLLPTVVLHRVYDGAVWRDTSASIHLLRVLPAGVREWSPSPWHRPEPGQRDRKDGTWQTTLMQPKG